MNITLKASNIFQLKDGFFLVKKGKLFIRNIFENGKVLGHNFIFKEGDIVGNFLQLLPKNRNGYDFDFVIEIVIIEDCELEKISIPEFSIDNPKNMYEKIISQLLKKQFLDILYILLPKQLYIMTTLAIMNQQGTISKKNINHENFNMSKSQFYNLLSKIKKEKIYVEKKEEIILNFDKINNHLEDFFWNFS